MLQPRARIIFTNQNNVSTELKVFNDISIHETYEKLTNKATIIFPRKYQDLGKEYFGGTNPVYRRGDKVVIYMGYYPNETKTFEGYIRDVNANIPVEVFCEDTMYLLKKHLFNIPSATPLVNTTASSSYVKRTKVNTLTKKSLMLKELLNIIIPDYIELSNEIIDMDLGKVRFSRVTPCEILDKLKDTHGLWSYFVDNKLYVGFANNALVTNEEEFPMERVIINSNDLYYKRAEDVPIKVEAISMDDTNAKLTASAGDEDGEVRTYHYYKMSQSALQDLANARLNEERYTGFHGTVATFLEPYVRHGDRANITSTKLPERNGVYLIKAVTRELGVRGGGRQYLELGVKVG